MTSSDNASTDKKEIHDAILKTALTLFTEKGYFNTSVVNIKQAAGVSTGSIYHHFKNKEAIGEALHSDIHERLLQSIEAVRRKHRTARERTQAIVELFFELTEQAPEVIRFTLLSRHQEFLPDGQPISNCKAFCKLRDILSAGMKAGEIRHMDSVLAYACFYGVVFQTIELHLDGVLKKPLKACLNTTWSAAWRSIAAS